MKSNATGVLVALLSVSLLWPRGPLSAAPAGSRGAVVLTPAFVVNGAKVNAALLARCVNENLARHGFRVLSAVDTKEALLKLQLEPEVCNQEPNLAKLQKAVDADYVFCAYILNIGPDNNAGFNGVVPDRWRANGMVSLLDRADKLVTTSAASVAFSPVDPNLEQPLLRSGDAELLAARLLAPCYLEIGLRRGRAVAVRSQARPAGAREPAAARPR